MIRLFVNSDPEEDIAAYVSPISSSLATQLDNTQIRVIQATPSLIVDVVSPNIDIREGLEMIAQTVVDCVCSALPPNLGVVIWMSTGGERNQLIYMRANEDDPSVRGEVYLPPPSS
ncbi:MAG: hypothetical protein IT340_09860 [Chloroflexi bacterium]|nr:hypothetical protein [Chloroflexota bacterium]